MSNGARLYAWIVERHPELSNVEEASQVLGVKRRTLYNWKSELESATSGKSAKGGTKSATSGTNSPLPPDTPPPPRALASSGRLLSKKDETGKGSKAHPCIDNDCTGLLDFVKEEDLKTRGQRQKEERERVEAGKKAVRTELMLFWQSEWERRRGHDYVPVAKDWNSLKRICGMARYDPEVVRHRMLCLLDAEDPFHADKASLPWLLSQWNQLNTIPGTRRPTRTRHEQMTHDTLESIFGPTGGGPESAWRSLPREVWPGDDAPLRGGALGPGPN